VTATLQQRKQETRRRVEETSLRLFADRGFDATTVNELAAAAGVGRRTFFRYFPSKNDVVFGAFEERGAALATALQAATTEGRSPVEMVRRAFHAANTYETHEYPSLAIRIWLISSVPSLQAHATMLYRSWENGLRTLLTGPMAGNRLHADALARASIAVMWAAFDSWLEAGAAGTDLARHIDAVFDALTKGFTSDGSAPA
jgi:AcrR family transcriptional regulator